MTYYRISPKPPKIEIHVTDKLAILKTPWRDEWFVEDLHKLIPSNDHWWDPRPGTWSVKIAHFDAFVKLVRDSFCVEPEIIQEAQ